MLAFRLSKGPNAFRDVITISETTFVYPFINCGLSNANCCVKALMNE